MLDTRQRKDRSRQRHRTEETLKAKAASLSVLSNAFLVLLKLAVGFITGSVSVLSEAFHSASDLVASSIALFSVRQADTPPDDDHPYGHGKIESVSGLAEALLIFVAASYIIYEAAQKLRNPKELHGHDLNAGLLVMALSAGLNYFISRYLRRVAKQTDSLALEADAEHLRADVLTSLGVLAGLALARFTGNPIFDPLTALAVALLIFHAAWRLTRDSLHPLLDVRLPQTEESAIMDVLDADTRVLDYHKLRTRKSGSQRHADVHILLDDSSTLIEAHDIAEDIEDKIRAVLPAMQVSIHMEPYQVEIQHQQQQHADNPAPSAKNATETPSAQEVKR